MPSDWKHAPEAFWASRAYLSLTQRQNGRADWMDETVMDDYTCLLDQPCSTDRQQVGIARPRANEIDGSGFCHARKMRRIPARRQSECVYHEEGQILKQTLCARQSILVLRCELPCPGS